MAAPPVDAGEFPPDTVGLVDISQGMWHLRNSAGVVTSFFYGNPGDLPVPGDWDGDGISTPGLYRQSDGFFYSRNSNTQGIADAECFAGNPEDVPLSGDWDGDGDDNLGIYRPSEQMFYLFTISCTGSPMGAAQISFLFGNPGDKPVVGDWDGDGIDEVGLHRESTGFFYWRDTLTTGIADGQIFYGDPADRFVAGDWGVVDGVDTPAVFRPSDLTFYFRHTLTQGNADSQFTWTAAGSGWLPVAGNFGLSIAPPPPPSPPPPPPPPPPEFSFGDGIWIVNSEIPPDTYRNNDSSGGCYWARLSGFGGTLGEIIANDFTFEIQIVTIDPADAGFESSACGIWSNDLSPRTPSPTSPFGGGDYQVGTEVAPTRWRNTDSSGGCFWERLSGFGGTLGDIIANQFSNVIEIVDISLVDIGFSSEDCGTWSTDLTPRTPSPTSPFGGGAYLVGSEVATGLWRNSDSSGGCYWERRSGFGGTFDDIITNSFSFSVQTVAISGSDVGFYSEDCGTWTKIG